MICLKAGLNMLELKPEDWLLAIDIGGTTVKYAYWQNRQLAGKGRFETPETWTALLLALLKLKQEAPHPIMGVAISLPGSVDTVAGKITGTSAVEYLNEFEIKATLKEAFDVPVTIQNDANCAALAEAWLGNAAGTTSSVLMIIGTGIGGSIVQDGHIWTGHDQFGGEFGYMVMTGQDDTLSELASPVKMANRYNRLTGSPQPVDAHVVFDRSAKGDEVARQCLDEMYHWLSVAAYNLIVSVNPDRLLLGGGISSREDVLFHVKQRVSDLLHRHGAAAIETEIMSCQFQNDANLVGAVYQFLTEVPATAIKDEKGSEK